MKVYCGRCKYFKLWSVYIGYCGYVCHCPVHTIYKERAIKQYSYGPDCEEVNRNNDCKYFEQKLSLFQRLKRWIKKCVK